MKMKETPDRRNWLRAKRVLSIQYRLYKVKSKNYDKRWYLSTTHDMSIGGLTFLTENQYKVSDTLELRVVMSGVLDIYNGFAKVVRVEQKKSKNICLIAVKYLNVPTRKRNAKSYQSTNSKLVKVSSQKKRSARSYND